LEPGDNIDGDEAVFCEGDCQGWIHRKYAGITHPVFEKLSSESTPYLCPHCILSKQYNEISTLKETIKTLNDKINKLEGKRTEMLKVKTLMKGLCCSFASLVQTCTCYGSCWFTDCAAACRS